MRTRILLASVVLVCACNSTDDVAKQSSEQAFVLTVRTRVPAASVYDDGQLKSAGWTICANLANDQSIADAGSGLTKLGRLDQQGVARAARDRLCT